MNNIINELEKVYQDVDYNEYENIICLDYILPTIQEKNLDKANNLEIDNDCYIIRILYEEINESRIDIIIKNKDFNINNLIKDINELINECNKL